MTRRRKIGRKRPNGNGTVYQRKDGRWVGRAYLLMGDGTTQRRDFYADTEAKVRGKLVDALSRSQQDVPAEATGWTLALFLAYWLEHIVRPARKPKTHHGYEVIVRVYLVPQLGRKKLHKLSAPDVRHFLTRMRNTCPCCLHGLDERRPEGQRRCCALRPKNCCQFPSDRLVQQAHAVLRNALQAAVREELLARNVAKLVQVSGPSYEINRWLNVEQARKFRATASEDRLEALYVLALYLGLRRGKLLGLRWDDIGLDAGALEVRRTLQRVGSRLQPVTPKTRSSRRTVPLIGLCHDALVSHKERQAQERAEAGSSWESTGYVFTSRRGTPIEPDNLRRSWYPLRDAAGLGPIRFHDLRHSCVTLLLDLGVPPHVVRDIVGHADIEVTMTIYAHASMTEKREAPEEAR
ncbi:site-specific integrase [Tenggerimyces flavus]|uniref:Tyrosine recombinase XerC n=1 Tax=Tenggerimyces flavus TaxID=1708749 RepID=A0ABV7YM57_9ACTN|nr:site-specific integrase [Tenggerimyces flavus]MBM7784966.1 integrase [Tenggerimyces flavus]